MFVCLKSVSKTVVLYIHPCMYESIDTVIGPLSVELMATLCVKPV